MQPRTEWDRKAISKRPKLADETLVYATEQKGAGKVFPGILVRLPCDLEARQSENTESL